MKKILLKSALFTLMLGLTTQVSAQTNPKKGYIITNQDDTIHGTIDYLTTMKCVEACLFQKDGETTYKKYLPTEIKGYRADDDALFYESRRLPFEDNEFRVLFAEYLVLGEVSLLHVPTSNKDYYYLIDKDGKLAQLKNYDDFDITTAKMKNIARQNIASMAPMFEKHPLTLEEFKMDSFNNRDLTRIIKKYDTTYCRDWGDCIQFEQQNEKKENFKTQFKLGLGFNQNTNKLWNIEDNRYYQYSTAAPYITAGYDIDILRFSKYFLLQTELSVSPTFKSNLGKNNSKLSYYETEFKVGGAFRLFNRDHKGLNPYVRGGGLLNYWLGYSLDKTISTPYYDHYYVNTKTPNSHTFGMGLYIGIGCTIPVGDKKIQFNTDYKQSTQSSLFLDKKGFEASAYYVF